MSLDPEHAEGERIVSQEQRTKVYRRSFIILWTILLLLGGGLVYRFYSLQIARGEVFAEKSEKNFTQGRRIPSIRGMIFDRKRRPLADNRGSFNLYLTPAFTKKPRQTLKNVDRLIGLNTEYLKKAEDAVKKARGLAKFLPIILAEDLDQERLALFEFHRLDLDGIDAVPVPHRSYPQGVVASHLLGYMGEIDQETLDRLTAAGKSYKQGDYIGKKGLELSYEDELKGVDGSETVLVDAKGRRVDEKGFKGALDGLPYQPAVPGKNLVLAMDVELQKAAEKAFSGKEGGVVALEAKTGYVLAMVSRPSIDPNILTGRLSRDAWWKLLTDPLKPLINKTTQDHNHPGSTFKIVGALAALDSGLLSANTLQSCLGSFKLGTKQFRCWKERGHGLMNLHASLVQSCDVYYYRLGERLGIEKLAGYARLLGFGEKSGIDILEEVPGVIPDTAFYNQPKFGGYQKGYAVNTSIGQGDVNVTLVQLAAAYAAIVNGGRLFKPQSVKEIQNPDGAVIKTFQPVLRRELGAGSYALDAIGEALSGVVNEPGGTAYSRRMTDLPDFKVGGKTGTAQVVAVGTKRLKAEEMDFEERDHAWFVAIAPVEDPEIVIAVINKHGGHGASGAAPIAMEVMRAYLKEIKGLEIPVNPPRAFYSRAEEADLEDSIYLPGETDGVIMPEEQ